VPVLVRDHTNRRGPDPQRNVLGDEGDVEALDRESKRHRKDPGVVGVGAETDRQPRLVRVVQLDPKRPALVVDDQRLVQPTVFDPEVVEDA
jgi:hypothetical protein